MREAWQRTFIIPGLGVLQRVGRKAKDSGAKLIWHGRAREAGNEECILPNLEPLLLPRQNVLARTWQSIAHQG